MLPSHARTSVPPSLSLCCHGRPHPMHHVITAVGFHVLLLLCLTITIPIIITAIMPFHCLCCRWDCHHHGAGNAHHHHQFCLPSSSSSSTHLQPIIVTATCIPWSVTGLPLTSLLPPATVVIVRVVIPWPVSPPPHQAVPVTVVEWGFVGAEPHCTDVCA